MIEPFFIAFLFAFLSEIADKTQLVILGLALEFRSFFKVFSGAFLAHVLMDGIAIFAASFFVFSIPSLWVKMIVGILFVLLGLWNLVQYFRKKTKKEKQATQFKNPFVSSFLLVLVSEFGDKTQISSGLLAATYLAPLSIFAGFALAIALVIFINLFIGSKIAKVLPVHLIKIATALFLILFGLFTLLFS